MLIILYYFKKITLKGIFLEKLVFMFLAKIMTVEKR